MPGTKRLQGFQRFLDAARELRTHNQSSITRRRSAAFQQFTIRTIDLLSARLDSASVRQQLRVSLTALRSVSADSPPDILEVAGLTFHENAYSELIRWAFCPQANGELAIAGQQLWLQRLGLPLFSLESDAAQVTSQIRTADGGIPDLILRFPSWVLIVEAKTGTTEHITSDGNYQSVAYPKFVRAELRLPDSMPVYLALLTPDRSAAIAAEALTTTYLEIATVLAEAVQQVKPAPPTRAAYQLIIRHFASKTVRREFELGALADALSKPDSDRHSIRKCLIPLIEFKHLALGNI